MEMNIKKLNWRNNITDVGKNKDLFEILADVKELGITYHIRNYKYWGNGITDKYYMNDEDGEATSRLQCWVVNNMRGEIMDWCSGIGIIEAVEHLYKTALENGNLSIGNGV